MVVGGTINQPRHVCMQLCGHIGQPKAVTERHLREMMLALCVSLDALAEVCESKARKHLPQTEQKPEPRARSGSR